MLVEDDAELLEIFMRRFAKRGFRVVACDNVDRILETAEAHEVSVAVMDRTLRGADCIDLIPQLRQLNRGIQVIVFSGLGDSESVEQALAVGASAYLVKPCGFADLSAAVDRACATLIS
jgi:DNA-binding response OmpR family regulator